VRLSFSQPILRSVRFVVAVVLVMLSLQAMPAAAGAQKLPRFAGCKSYFARSAPGTVRPRSIVLACGDGNLYVTRIEWSRWTMREARGVGVGHQNDCVPDCARGHFHRYRVALRLYRVRDCGAPKVAQFTRAFWAFTASKPVGVSRSGVEIFRCRKG
jgi:hypothetical protein